MVAPSPGSLLRQASGWAILWGVLLILFGILAIGSPLLAAVTVSAVIAWLIILAGVIHLVVAFHAHGAGSMIWKALVGLAYIFIGGYLLDTSALGSRVTDAAAGIPLLHRGRAGRRALLQSSSRAGRRLGSVRRHRDSAAGIVHWHSLAVEFGLGDWHAGGREHDHQRSGTRDDVIGGAETE